MLTIYQEGRIRLGLRIQLVKITTSGSAAVLGPIIFIIYLNSLLNTVNDGTIASYADDTFVVFESDADRHVRKRVHTDSFLIKNWLDFNKQNFSNLRH